MRLTFGLMLITATLLGAAQSREIKISLEPGNEDGVIPAAVLKVADEAYEANLKGLDALDKGDYDGAEGWFRQALSIVPNYTDAENNIGVGYYRKGSLSQASTIWETILRREADYPLALYNLGIMAFYDKQYRRAGELFGRSRKTGRGPIEASIMLGRTLAEEGRQAEALEAFRQAYKTNPKDQNAWSHFSYALIQKGDTASALKILGEHADNAESLKMMGTLAVVRGDAAKGAEYLAKSVEKGNAPSLLVDLAGAQVGAGNFRSASATLARYFALAGVHPSADAWLYAGIASKENNDLKSARNFFEKGIEAYPADPILRYNLGQIFFYLRDYQNAQRVLTPLSDTLQDPVLYYVQALEAYRTGAMDRAEAMIRRAIKLDERAEYHDMLGTVLFKKGKTGEAANAYRKALKISPELRSAQLNLALTTTSSADLDKAIAAGNRQLDACHDTCDDVALRLSALYFTARQYEKALWALQKIPEPGRDGRYYRHLALCFRELQQWDKSIAALEKLNASFVADPQTVQQLADSYLMAGFYSKAIGILEGLAKKGDGEIWRVEYQLGYAWMELNNLQKAQASFEKSLRMKTDNPAARGLLAYVLNRQGKAAAARDLWQQNVMADPGNVTLQINLGLSLEKEGKYAEALEYYRKAASLQPGSNEIQINIGNALAAQKMTVEAMRAYTLALNSTKKELAAYNIFLLCERTRNNAKAHEMVDLLSRQSPSSTLTQRCKASMALWEGDTAGAIHTLESIADRDEADHLLLAKVLAARNEPAKAAQHLARVPNDSTWRNERADVTARIAFARGDCKAALDAWARVRDTSVAFQYNRALAALTCKDFALAASIGERMTAATRGEDRADFCRVTGNAWFGLKEWDKARKWYLQLSDFAGNNALVNFNLAVASYNLGNVDDMWRYYEKARQLDGTIRNEDIEKRHSLSSTAASPNPTTVIDSADQWYNAAVDLQQKDTAGFTVAESLYSKILAKDSSYVQAWNNLGAIWSARAELEKAEVCYQRAISKRHDLPEAYANLVNVYVAMNNLPQAKRWVIKGLGHNPESEALKELEGKVNEMARVQDKKRK